MVPSERQRASRRSSGRDAAGLTRGSMAAVCSLDRDRPDSDAAEGSVGGGRGC